MLPVLRKPSQMHGSRRGSTLMWCCSLALLFTLLHAYRNAYGLSARLLLKRDLPKPSGALQQPPRNSSRSHGDLLTGTALSSDSLALKVTQQGLFAEQPASAFNQSTQAPGKADAGHSPHEAQGPRNAAFDSIDVKPAAQDTPTVAPMTTDDGDRTPPPNSGEHVDNVLGLHGLAIEAANKAAKKGALHVWIHYLNLYLEQYKATRLHLSDYPGPLLARIESIPLPVIDTGPLVTVIMVTHNVENTIVYAVKSILLQTWKSLELIIVDDASEDDTWPLATRLSQLDARIKLVKNPVKVGPYVSRNRVLSLASGVYVTTQDADDWAFPRRLESQVRNLIDSGGRVRANMMHMLRVRPSGEIATAMASSFTPDGVARQAFVSAMYETNLLREDLGYWDSVLYGADSEMIRRAQTYLGRGFAELNDIGVLLADRSNSLGKQGYQSDPHVPRQVWQGWAGSKERPTEKRTKHGMKILRLGPIVGCTCHFHCLNALFLHPMEWQ